MSRSLKHLNLEIFGLFRISNFGFRASPVRGFTLIESLAVISILGILATSAIYIYTSATSRSRDARRKSDLTAISLGFQARHDALACPGPNGLNDVGYYPGRDLGWSSEPRWKNTEVLRDLTNDCGSFSQYLLTIPTDPTEGDGSGNYRFDLSTESAVVGKHYRLTTKLEKSPNESEQAALVRAQYVWENSFGGASLPDDYNYIIGN